MIAVEDFLVIGAVVFLAADRTTLGSPPRTDPIFSEQFRIQKHKNMNTET
ncbi:MAG: hypothetical protein ACTSQI_11695 [Candidatus Helarchaeota archaeon]